MRAEKGHSIVLVLDFKINTYTDIKQSQMRLLKFSSINHPHKHDIKGYIGYDKGIILRK